jgi:hypothetical protein
MNAHYVSYVDAGRCLAQKRRIKWQMTLDDTGVATKETAWDLAKFIGDPTSTIRWLRDFGTDLAAANAVFNQSESSTDKEKHPLSAGWIDLIKAVVMDQLFSRRNSPQHILGNVVRPLRVLATCTLGTEPWELRIRDVERAYEVAIELQRCGKLGDLVLGVIRYVLDANHIPDIGPLFPLLPFSRKTIHRLVPYSRASSDSALMQIEERKRADRLPDERAFWELVRIIFTECPQSYLDAIRFAMLKIMILTGLRINEVALLPLDWRRSHEYFDADGIPADRLGGYSRCISLRYFAEKQQTTWSDSVVLYENSQFVPIQFETILTSVIEDISRISHPLRQTLRLQNETNRLLPWYSQDSLVSVLELYPRLTGNPVLVDGFSAELKEINRNYHTNFDSAIFAKLRHDQLTRAQSSILSSGVYQFCRDLRKHVVPRSVDGIPIPSEKKNIKWAQIYFRIDEIESYLLRVRQTKLPNTAKLQLSNGELAPWQLLMLVPKRAIAEGRSDGICDVATYYAVGRATDQLLLAVLGGKSALSLFQKYGATEADRNLSINTHSFRHLQNNELFRLGVADTIITKRFGRRSVTQSYEYDHRTLSEQLAHIELPPNLELELGKKASTVAKLIKTGNASGPIVESFKQIQTKQGDDAAFKFLRVEADGFHSTPYGHCLNSFTVDPCPKHLECFSGCRHLSSTGLAEHNENLIKLHGRLQAALDDLHARSTRTIGHENQIRHIKERITGINKLLATSGQGAVFPEGGDKSEKKI